MSLFFFDVEDGECRSRDDDGREFPNQETARKNAVRTLSEIARYIVPDGVKRDLAVTVRDKDGSTIFRATLAFRAEWLTP